MKWTIIFLLGRRELAEKMADFLRARLNSVYTYEVRAGDVVVGFGPNVRRPPTKDDAWKLVGFIKNQSGLNPRFVIEGRDDQGKVRYISACSRCINGEGEHDGHGQEGQT